MTTVYSAGIDDSISLPLASDLSTQANSSVYNAIRAAIIAVENELGIKPSGTFGTVRARLDDLDARFTVLDDSVIRSLEDNGTVVSGGPFTTLNFVGGAVITDGGSGVANVNITGGGGGSSVVIGNVITAPDWYINPVSGNDADVGTNSIAAVKTWAGLRAKWGFLPRLAPTGGILTIHLLGDLSATDGIYLREDVVIAADVQVVVRGKTTTVRTSTLTGATAVNRGLGTSAPWKAVDSTVSNWGPDVRRRLRITSGANSGATCWIAADVGSHTADVSAPIIPTQIVDGNFSLPAISNTDPYVIETLSFANIEELSPSIEPGTSTTTYPILFIQDLQIGSLGIFGTVIHSVSDVAFQGCRFSNFESTSTGQNPNEGSNFVGCCFDPGGFFFAIGACAFYAGVAFGEISSGNQIGATPFFDCDFMMYGANARFVPTAISIVGTMGAFNLADDGVHIFQGLYLVNATQGIHALYGAGNTGYGVRIDVANAWLRAKTTAPTITGTSGDIIIHGATSLVPWNDAAHQLIDGPILCSWANLTASIASGGFGGAMLNLQSAAFATVEASLDSGVVPYVLTGSNLDFTPGIATIEHTAAGLTTKLPSSPILNQRLRLICLDEGAGSGSPGGSPAVLDGNGNNINGSATYSQVFVSQVIDVVYNGTEWRLVSAEVPNYSQIGGTGTEIIKPQEFNSTIDPKGTLVDRQPEHITTANATLTTLATFDLSALTTGAFILTAVVSAIKSDGSQGAAYIRTAAFRRVSGTITQIGTTQDGGSFADDPTWDCQINISSSDVLVQVKGAASTNITWTAADMLLKVFP